MIRFALTNHPTKEDVDNAVKSKQDALTSSQTDAIDSGVTKELVAKLKNIEEGAQKNPDLSPYAKKTEIPEIPDMSGYALKKELEDEELRATSAERAINLKIESIEVRKVEKILGKGLSTNDYTNDEKDKLAEIEEGAQRNVPVIAPSPDGEGKAADAKAVYDELELIGDQIYGVQTLAGRTEAENIKKPFRSELPMVGKSPIGRNVYSGDVVEIENGGFYNIWSDCTLLLPCVTRKPNYYVSRDNPKNGNSYGVPIKFLVRIASDSVPVSDVMFAEDTGRIIVSNASFLPKE